ncbi:MAG: hypothetical protein Ta2E_02240 [Mycoplasmoidaceae bacterium]|nr:MAG: hypothetical protein Ta2E_02240 [Mycoplasmoidaceae bacterium]
MKLSRLCLITLGIASVGAAVPLIITSCAPAALSNVLPDVNDEYFADIDADVATYDGYLECKYENSEPNHISLLKYYFSQEMINSAIGPRGELNFISDQSRIKSFVSIDLQQTEEDKDTIQQYEDIICDSETRLTELEEALYQRELLKSKYTFFAIDGYVKMVPYALYKISNPTITQKIYNEVYPRRMKINPLFYNEFTTKLNKLYKDNYIDPNYNGWKGFNDLSRCEYDGQPLSNRVNTFFSAWAYNYFGEVLQGGNSRRITFRAIELKFGESWATTSSEFDNLDISPIFDIFPNDIKIEKELDNDKQELVLYVTRNIVV